MLCTENVGRTNGGKFITWKVNVIMSNIFKKEESYAKMVAGLIILLDLSISEMLT